MKDKKISWAYLIAFSESIEEKYIYHKQGPYGEMIRFLERYRVKDENYDG